jgi:hypothetical protein
LVRGQNTVSAASKLRQWWQAHSGWEDTPIDGAAPAWFTSFVVHFAALLALATATLLLPAEHRPVVLSAQPVELESQPAVEEFRFSQERQETVGALSAGGIGDAAPQSLIAGPEMELAFEAPEIMPVGNLQVVDISQAVLQGRNPTENVLIRGAGSTGTTGAAGAVDRITNEILLSLDERPTLVVWLFDQSGSLKAQREAIAKRFDRVYDELGIIEAAGNPAFQHHDDKPLLTAVASFGETVNLLTKKPTDDVVEIKEAVRHVVDDPSGRENVFQAVHLLADKFRHYRLKAPRRNVMIVAFTDEAGDDVNHLDATIEMCRKLAMPVYVVGVPAPFGREDAYVKYVDPDPKFDQSVQWLPVHQGPESLLPERIKLNFSGEREYDERIDSGFGPYGLCRLTSETGGLYFTVHPNRRVGEEVPEWETAAYSSHLAAFFDERVMRNYRPDYVTVDQYYDFIAKNRACGALVQAAQLSWTTPMERVRRRFPKVDDAQLARDLAVAQRSAAKVEPQINQLVNVLRQGEAERPKVTKPRWQAGYDLAIGRALAVKVRTEGYNAMLAEAKQGLQFKKPRSDTWILRPSRDVTINSALAKDATAAEAYLKRVVAEHPETPWALDAERELKQPFGWKWTEDFTDVARRMAEAENSRRRRPERPLPPEKPRRDPPAL